MLKTIYRAALCAAAVALTASPAAAAVQILTFGGTLQNGFNNTGGPFGPGNTSLTGQTYSVQLSYDPSLFVSNNFTFNSCGPNPGSSCSYQFSTTRTLTQTLTVNGTSQTNILTAGTLTFTSNGTGGDNINFSFQGATVFNLSGNFTDGNSFFPNQNNVNGAVLNFTNLALSSPGTFNQSGPGYSLGGNPTTLSASFVAGAVPEPATWAMMIGGFALVGSAIRGRRRPIGHAIA